MRASAPALAATAAIAALATAGCASEIQTYERARADDTATAYEDYLARWPESERVDDVRRRLADVAAFDEAMTAGSTERWIAFIDAHPRSHRRDKAENALEAIYADKVTRGRADEVRAVTRTADRPFARAAAMNALADELDEPPGLLELVYDRWHAHQAPGEVYFSEHPFRLEDALAFRVDRVARERFVPGEVGESEERTELLACIVLAEDGSGWLVAPVPARSTYAILSIAKPGKMRMTSEWRTAIAYAVSREDLVKHPNGLFGIRALGRAEAARVEVSAQDSGQRFRIELPGAERSISFALLTRRAE